MTVTPTEIAEAYQTFKDAANGDLEVVEFLMNNWVELRKVGSEVCACGGACQCETEKVETTSTPE